ncbi:MAG: hypothetical protein C1O27_001659 [Chloroflexi bacterium]|jgi:hypothetical protein|nr:MAG: hypothetical protein C1O27_001659 [Chloroflexota bacterium]
MSNTKPFLMLVVAALVIGGALGGSFLGGVAVGEAKTPDATVQLSSGQVLPTPQSQEGADQLSINDLATLRERIQSGDVSQEEIEQIRSQFQGLAGQDGGGFAQGGGGAGGFGGGGTLGDGGLLQGVVEAIDGNMVSVDTPQGVLQAAIDENTLIQLFSSGTAADLGEGITVTVVGARNEDGVVVARTITIGGEGLAQGPFGGRGDFRQGGQP